MFEGRGVALVTGGASGLGRAVVGQLARGGHRVVLADRDLAGARHVVEKVRAAGGRAHAIEVDVTDPASVSDMVEEAAAIGPLRVAVNNAGIAGVGVPVADYPVDAWLELMRVNLDGVFYCLKYEIPAMVDTGGGSVVNMASVLGTVGRANASAYVAAKHAVVGLTRSAALEYAAVGVRVNAVAPGFVITPLNEARLDESARASLERAHALGRLGRPEEVARVVCFLAGEDSSFVTGSCHVVDGGYSAH